MESQERTDRSGRRRHAAPSEGRRDQPTEAADRLQLQQRAGNQAVGELIQGAQAKLAVGASDDPLEREADAVAAEVVDAVRTGDIGGATTRIQRRRAGAARTADGDVAGPDGGLLDDATEQAVRAAGGGRALPPEIQRSMETAFGGADFGDVRLHTGSQASELNDRLGAEAFTVGSDVFLRDGMPDATDPLLPHELTHVVQQGHAGVANRQIRRAPSPSPQIRRWKKGVAGGGSGGGGTQESSTDSSSGTSGGDTSGHKVVAPSEMTAAYPLKGATVETRASTTLIRPGAEITVDYRTSVRRHGVDDDTDSPASLLPIVAGKGALGEELAGRYVRLSALGGGGGGGTTTTDTVIGDLGTASTAYGTVGDVGTHFSDESKKNPDDESLSTTSDNLGYASGAGDVAGMFVTLAASIRTFKKKDSSAWDKGEAALDTAKGAGTGAKGISDLVKTATDSGGKSAEASGGLGMFTGIFSGIKSTFTTVHKAVDLAKEARKKEKTNQERFHDAMEVVKGLLDAAKSGVSTAKTFLTTFGDGPSAALTNSVPGLGIAVGAADLIVRSVDLVYSMVHAAQMRAQKRLRKIALGGRKGASSEDEAKAIITKVEKLEGAGDPVPDADLDAYANAREYLLAKGVQWINTKRRNRALLKMSVAMGKISGDVATLGGASAPVGIGLKAGSLALDVGASVFRRFKQWARDKKAEKEEKSGKEVTTGFFAMFDAEKSTGAKMKKYGRMVDQIYDMIIKADSLPAPDPDTRFKGVDRYVRAMGMAPEKMYKLRDKPGELRAELIAALQKRE